MEATAAAAFHARSQVPRCSGAGSLPALRRIKPDKIYPGPKSPFAADLLHHFIEVHLLRLEGTSREATPQPVMTSLARWSTMSSRMRPLFAGSPPGTVGIPGAFTTQRQVAASLRGEPSCNVAAIAESADGPSAVLAVVGTRCAAAAGASRDPGHTDRCQRSADDGLGARDETGTIGRRDARPIR